MVCREAKNTIMCARNRSDMVQHVRRCCRRRRLWKEKERKLPRVNGVMTIIHDCHGAGCESKVRMDQKDVGYAYRHQHDN